MSYYYPRRRGSAGSLANMVVGLTVGSYLALHMFGGAPLPHLGGGGGHAAEAIAGGIRPPAGAVTEAGPAACGCTVTTMPGNANEQLADRMAARAGWSPRQVTCMNLQLSYESARTWNPAVTNPSSGAYGIVQALPPGKLAAYGADWRTSAATQIRFYLSYAPGRYGSLCGSWAFELRNNFY